MKNRKIPILIAILIIAVGYIVKKIRISKYAERLQYTINYNNKFIELINLVFEKGKLDTDLYNFCIHDVDKIQQELGGDGIISDYIDNLHGVKGSNYQLFMNIMPELRQMLSFDNMIVRERVGQLVGYCDDALKRHIGNVERKIEAERKQLYNPFSCFGEGIRWTIGLPVDILLWCGIINRDHNQHIKANGIVEFLNKVIVFLGLVSSVMTILLGWNEFVELLCRAFRLN